MMILTYTLRSSTAKFTHYMLQCYYQWHIRPPWYLVPTRWAGHSSGPIHWNFGIWLAKIRHTSPSYYLLLDINTCTWCTNNSTSIEQASTNSTTYNVDDDIIVTDACSCKYWRHDIIKPATDSCSYSHHSAARNVKSKHCAEL